jgi:hypothetical protein
MQKAHERGDDLHSARKSPLEFHDWIPPYIRDVAQVIYIDANTPQDIELLRRLVLDPRLERVWNELLKKKRKDYKRVDQYVHPVTEGAWSFRARLLQSRAVELRKMGENTRADCIELRALLQEFDVPNLFNRLSVRELSLQERGLSFLFYTAFSLARPAPLSLSVAQTRNATLPFSVMADRLRADAAEQQRLRGFSDQRLLEAAVAYDELAEDAGGPLGTTVVVNRKSRGDVQRRGFVKALASTTQAVFGHSLYGTVATLTNVALKRNDITAEKVRKMVFSRPMPLTNLCPPS